MQIVRPAYGDEPDTRAASEHFRNGVDATNRGELARAADEFEAAYLLSPNPVVLYNLGQTQTALGRPVQALRSLRLYLETDPPPDPERVREVEALIRANQRSLGELELELVPPHARLQIDAAPVTLDGGKVSLARGRHVVSAELEGYLTSVTSVEVTAESTTRLRLELKPVLPVALAPSVAATGSKKPDVSRVLAEPDDVAPQPSSGLSATSIVALAGAGLGVAALGLGTIFALTSSSIENAARKSGHCNSQSCDAVGLPLREDAYRYGNAATGLFIGGGALVAAGVTVHFVWGSSAKPKTKR